jgi:hypothetical protein
VCASSALLLAEDESTSIINGALVGVLLSQSTSPSVVCLSSPRTINLGFLIEGKILLQYSSHLPLGVPNGLVIYHTSSYFSGAIAGELKKKKFPRQLHASKYFSGTVAGEEEEDFCEGSFHTHILYIVLSFALLYFTCIVLSKTQKN